MNCMYVPVKNVRLFDSLKPQFHLLQQKLSWWWWWRRMSPTEPLYFGDFELLYIVLPSAFKSNCMQDRAAGSERRLAAHAILLWCCYRHATYCMAWHSVAFGAIHCDHPTSCICRARPCEFPDSGMSHHACTYPSTGYNQNRFANLEKQDW